jgi:hypothetical protein
MGFFRDNKRQDGVKAEWREDAGGIRLFKKK